MASGVYNRFKANLMNKEVDLNTDSGDTIKVMLLSGGHSFTATDDVITDVSGSEVTGAGYTLGGATLVSGSVTQAATTKWDADDTAWTSASFTADHAVIYDDTVATDDLISSIDFGGSQTVTAGTFTIEWHADGIITLA